MTPLLKTLLHNPDDAPWVPNVNATLVCLVALLLAVVVEPWSPMVAVALLLVSFAAGMRFTLPETAESLASGRIDVDFLMILVALGAWLLGHPEEGAMLLVLFNASRAMEAYARERTHASVKELMSDAPREATRVSPAGEERVAVEELSAGDAILVRPGERFPVDCEISEGRSVADLSMITGESAPLEIRPGSEIPSGAVNGNGLVRATALRPASESAWQKIIALIENAPARRSPAQVLSDRIGTVFTVVILSASIVGFLLWWLAMGLSIQDAGYRAMVLLVAGSPCAIVLSIPSAILAAISAGARRGVLFNGGRGLSTLTMVRKAAFDKTGTLSVGIPGVLKVSGDGATDREVLSVAYTLARSSTHPASAALVRYLEEQGHAERRSDIEHVNEKPGRGVEGVWREQHLALGRPRGCDAFDDGDREYSRVILYIHGKPRVRFYLSETPRDHAADTIRGLAERGITSMIISGDVQPAVDRMAKLVGVGEARGELRPDDKWRIVREETEKQPIMMIGDGVNDAPALAEAHVGVAMGVRGSAATLAQADIILVKDRLPDLLAALDLAQRTRRIIRQNLTIAIGAAGIMLLFAAAGSLPLTLGVFGHEGGTVLVVLNSLRLLGGGGAASKEQAKNMAPTAGILRGA